MKKSHATLVQVLLPTLLVALVATPVHAQSGKKAKKLYCWEEAGRKVCGDALPASAVDSARTEINARSGMPTAQIGRTLTADERAAAAQQQELDQQAQLAEAARRMREHAMAESYATEDDLRRAFNERMALLDDTIKATQLSIGGLRQSLISLLRQAGEAELAGKPVPKTLNGTIQSQHAELIRQQGLLVTHRQNRSEIDADLAHALETYRSLKTPKVPQAIAPASGGSA